MLSVAGLQYLMKEKGHKPSSLNYTGPSKHLMVEEDLDKTTYERKNNMEKKIFFKVPSLYAH